MRPRPRRASSGTLDDDDDRRRDLSVPAPRGAASGGAETKTGRGRARQTKRWSPCGRRLPEQKAPPRVRRVLSAAAARARRPSMIVASCPGLLNLATVEPGEGEEGSPVGWRRADSRGIDADETPGARRAGKGQHRPADDPGRGSVRRTAAAPTGTGSGTGTDSGTGTGNTGTGTGSGTARAIRVARARERAGAERGGTDGPGPETDDELGPCRAPGAPRPPTMSPMSTDRPARCPPPASARRRRTSWRSLWRSWRSWAWLFAVAVSLLLFPLTMIRIMRVRTTVSLGGIYLAGGRRSLPWNRFRGILFDSGPCLRGGREGDSRTMTSVSRFLPSPSISPALSEATEGRISL